ncbi:acyltransferase family protein [Pseudoclavibacter sp. AY1H1]|uniref:acyltransferase family protein n=1 Tax=Pseudoclavibacter sp. AY1H1 TaxID=2080584 RepID=UPI000CE86BA7|nr:acyltransferase family protein [Pseudoclavibacter sp. AY1H1]PPF34362.1 acyltransferase [Pseudoclavibacter sp. AY1H1]
MTSATPPRGGFRNDIQGLRAIAVGAVVLYHAGVPFLTGGYVGVDVFFVISGFLITSHLLATLNRDGRISFASFYAKRVRRILPASFVVLALSVLAALIWYPPLLLREVWTGAVATALYVPNYLFAAQGTNYLAETTPSLFQHYWSLGIEEQFYLIWPVLIALGFALFKRPRALLIALVALVALSFAAGVLLTYQSQPWAFFGLPTRAWELGVGGIIAFVLVYRPSVVDRSWGAPLAWLGLAGILAPVFLFTSATPFPSFWAAIPVLGTAAVILGGSASGGWGPARALSVRPMLFVGTISYSLYLVHWPLLVVPQTAVGYESPLPLWQTLALGAVAFPLAWLMYRFVEDPARKARWLTSARPRRSLLAAAAASATAIALVGGSFVYSNSQPLYVDRAATAGALTAPPTATDFVPSNLQPSLRSVSGDQPDIYADGCHLDFEATAPASCIYGESSDPRIVLFGDSHAAQWFPAVSTWALANGYSVESHTKSSCPSISAPLTRNAVPYAACDEWRTQVLDHISAIDPALVLIANYGQVTFLDDGGSYQTAWASALGATFDAVDAPVALIADTPDMGSTPAICLSNHLSDADACDVERSRALETPVRGVEVDIAAASGVPLLDLTPYICGESMCPTIIGDTLVYRDAHHLTATFSSELSGAFGEALTASGLIPAKVS